MVLSPLAARLKETELYLVRHGQTAFNDEGRLQGWRDSPLTDLGRTQAQRHGVVLKTLISNPDNYRVVSSPQGRALDTARIICAGLGLGRERIETDVRLREMSFGDWEGMTLGQVDAGYPGAWRARRQDRWCYVPPGGENYEMISSRVESWLNEVHAPTLVVCHGITGRVLRGLYGLLSKDETLAQDEPQDAVFRLMSGTITRFEHLQEN